MPHLLELFSGTQGVSQTFAAHGWTTTTLDLEPKRNPDICCNILDVTREPLPQHVACIWASPDCTPYSNARTTARLPRDMEGADRLVRRAIEIAGFYTCPLFLDNHVGRLRGRGVVSTLYLRSVDYCPYKDERFAATYKKPTCIWANTSWIPQRALCNRWTCQSCENGIHRSHAQRLSTVAGEVALVYPQRQLIQIPPALIDDIRSFVTSQLRDAPPERGSGPQRDGDA